MKPNRIQATNRIILKTFYAPKAVLQIAMNGSPFLSAKRKQNEMNNERTFIETEAVFNVNCGRSGTFCKNCK